MKEEIKDKINEIRQSLLELEKLLDTDTKKVNNYNDNTVKTPWTNEDSRILKEFRASGVSAWEISKKMGKSINTVKNRIKIEKLPLPVTKKYKCIDCDVKFTSTLLLEDIVCEKNNSHKIIQI